MNKKQAVIILTLLVLIICAGVLAPRMNDPLSVDVNDSGKSTPSASTTQKSSNDNYFTETKLVKTTNRNNAITTFKQMADDKNVSIDTRNNAAAKATLYAANAVTESNIEAVLKGKGYEDVICWIDDEDPKVRVLVKSKDKLTDQQMRNICDVASSLAHIKNIQIQIRQ